MRFSEHNQETDANLQSTGQLIVFTLEDFRYGLHLSSVERIVRVVEITPLPQSPGIVLGAINFKGEVIPVVNVRKRFRLPERELNLSDQLLIAHTSRRKVALLVDAAIGVMDCAAAKIVEAKNIVPGLEYVAGVVKLDDGLVLIHNLDTFLSLDEENALAQAMT